MNENRSSWTAEQKLAIVQEERSGASLVSEVCPRYGISVGMFYAWEKRAPRALEALRRRSPVRPNGQASQLAHRLDELRAVVPELITENLG